MDVVLDRVIEEKPGLKVGFIEVPGAEDPILVPVGIRRGQRVSPSLCVVGGTHPTEYCGIEAAVRLIRDRQNRLTGGTLVVVPVANVPGFPAKHLNVSPVDGLNFNRLFPGNLEGTASEMLAYHLWNRLFKHCDYLIDLHGGDLTEEIVPFVIASESGTRHVNSQVMTLAECYDAGLVWRTVPTPEHGYADRGMLTAEATRAGIPAIIGEAGGQGLVDENAVEVHLHGIRNVLRFLGLLEGEPDLRTERTLITTRPSWIRAERDSMFRAATRAGRDVEAGDFLGTCCDFTGASQSDIVAPIGGTVMFVNTGLAARKGESLVAIADVYIPRAPGG
jgi:predicted deacylase